jgi:transcriptional regulator with XRE-family HTH domain
MSNEKKSSQKKPSAPVNPPWRAFPQAETAMHLMNMTMGLTNELTSGAFRLLTNNNGISLLFGQPLLSPDQQQLMNDTGVYIRELRELSGLTMSDLSTQLNLKDHTLIEAVENGTATLSFELIMRFAAIVARHDPVPVVMRLVRVYNPGMWEILSGWGVGRLALQTERERQFVNILRGNDDARELSDETFAKVLDFTRAAFEMAMQVAGEREQAKSD